MLLPEEAVPGDYVLVHAGFAMQKVDADTAEQSLEFFSRLVIAGEDAGHADEEAAEILRRGTIRWDGSEQAAEAKKGTDLFFEEK